MYNTHVLHHWTLHKMNNDCVVRCQCQSNSLQLHTDKVRVMSMHYETCKLHENVYFFAILHSNMAKDFLCCSTLLLLELQRETPTNSTFTFCQLHIMYTQYAHMKWILHFNCNFNLWFLPISRKFYSCLSEFCCCCCKLKSATASLNNRDKTDAMRVSD